MDLYYEEVLKGNANKYEERVSTINKDFKNLNAYSQAMLGEIVSNKINILKSIISMTYEELKFYNKPDINNIDILLKKKIEELNVIKETLSNLSVLNNTSDGKYISNVIESPIAELENQLEKIESYIPLIWKDLIIMIAIDLFNIDKYDIDFPTQYSINNLAFQLNFDENSIPCLIKDKKDLDTIVDCEKVIDTENYRLYYNVKIK